MFSDTVVSSNIQLPENNKYEPAASRDEPETFNDIVCDEEPVVEKEPVVGEEHLHVHVLEILDVTPQTEIKVENSHKQVVDRWTIIVKKA